MASPAVQLCLVVWTDLGGQSKFTQRQYILIYCRCGLHAVAIAPGSRRGLGQ